jgi:hypothetical protein
VRLATCTSPKRSFATSTNGSRVRIGTPTQGDGLYPAITGLWRCRNDRPEPVVRGVRQNQAPIHREKHGAAPAVLNRTSRLPGIDRRHRR